MLSLGPILWDFIELKIKFIYNGRLTCLKGLTSTCSGLIDDKECCRISVVKAYHKRVS